MKKEKKEIKINRRDFYKESSKCFSSCTLRHIIDRCPVEVSDPDDIPL